MRTPIRVHLESTSKRCGNCGHRGECEVSLCLPEWEQLQSAAHQILEAKPHGPLLKSQDMIALASFYEKLATQRIYCRKEKTQQSFLEPACSLWRARRAPVVFAV